MTGGLVAALLAVAAVAALVGAAALHLRYWERRLSVVVPYAEERRIPTGDGSAIELRRLATPSAPLPTPVLLVHGLGANHRNLDVHPDLSLARHLAEAGHDVWLLTLRTGRRDVRRGERLGFGAMAQHDVPLGVDEVLSRTRAPALDYVGFSMGGMLLYAALGEGVDPARVRRAVLIGAPGRVGSPLRLGRRLLAAWRFGIPFRGAARLAAFLVDHVRTPLHGVVYNRRNAAPGLAAVAMMDTLADLPGELYRELQVMGAAGGELRAGGAAVLPKLARIAVPALFVAGNADRLAPPESVRAAYEAWGAAVAPPVPKRFLLLGKEAGAEDDYGHGDLVIGRHLAEDLFAPVAAFLAD